MKKHKTIPKINENGYNSVYSALTKVPLEAGMDDYYPFGLPIAWTSYVNEGALANYYLYQGKEYRDKDGLNLYDFHARQYDPALGRFLAVDPAGQFSNPYLGMGNNQVMGVDPDGEFVFTALIPGVGVFIDAALWGAVIGGASYTASVGFSSGGFDNWNWNDFGKAAGMGAVSGVASAGIGSIFGGVGGTGALIDDFGKELGRAMFHGHANLMINSLFGNEVSLSNYLTGAASSLAGSSFHGIAGGNVANSVGGQIAFSSLVGGVTSEATGGDFWEGAATGAIIGSLNHAKHTVNTSIHVKAVRAFLIDAGFNEGTVKSDVIYQTGKLFSAAYAKFDGDIEAYGDYFEGGQWDSYSDTHDAFVSKPRTPKGLYNGPSQLSVKYYPSRNNSIGLVQTGFNHILESALEGIDGKVRDNYGYDNFIYNMHDINSRMYLGYRLFYN